MRYDEILQIIKNKLGNNYQTTDNDILESILKNIINDASFISNREINLESADINLKILSPEIIEATIISYQERGVEYTKSQSELGMSNTFIDPIEFLRDRIVKNGKRVIF